LHVFFHICSMSCFTLHSDIVWVFCGKGQEKQSSFQPRNHFTNGSLKPSDARTPSCPSLFQAGSCEATCCFYRGFYLSSSLTSEPCTRNQLTPWWANQYYKTFKHAKEDGIIEISVCMNLCRNAVWMHSFQLLYGIVLASHCVVLSCFVFSCLFVSCIALSQLVLDGVKRDVMSYDVVSCQPASCQAMQCENVTYVIYYRVTYNV